MAAKRVATKTAPADRSPAKPEAKPRTVQSEAGEAKETERSVGKVLQRCAEARAMPAPLEALEMSPALHRPRGTPSAQCAKRIQREMSRAMPQICEMLLRETIDGKNLAALRVLLQLAAFYGAKRKPGVLLKAPADTGFARRVMEEFRLRTEETAAAAEKTPLLPGG